MRVRVESPAQFSFERTVLSHGWCLLAPFRLGSRASSLGTTVALGQGGAVSIELRGAEDAVEVSTPGRPPATVRTEVSRAVRRMLGLDLDLSEFHAHVRLDPDLRWIARAGAGRLLRAPHAWEDLVKLVLTTNCTWTLTTRMVETLVARYGEPALDGHRSFPRAAVLASANEPALREEARLGYRARYVLELATRVAEGRVSPEAWDHDPRPDALLKQEMLGLPGVGPYVAENLLKFLGRPQGLALDSWMRAKYARLHHEGRPVTDRTIARRYGKLGRWAGPALWFSLTRDWFVGNSPSSAWDELA